MAQVGRRGMEIEWRKLRADQLREKARQGAMVICPFGSVEQHGPHLPVEVDSRLGEEVALRTARLIAQKEPVLVLPMFWAGIAEHHMSFGGTITLDFPTYLAVVRGICESVARHGFKRIVLLNGHGGNDNALRVIADELTPKLKVPILQMTYWYAAATAVAKNLDTQKELLHACEAETSMMMALRPELVARDRIALARANTTPHVKDLVGPGIYSWRALGASSSSGVWGNPEAASPEKGERLLDAIAEELAGKLTNKDLWALPILADKVEP